MKILLILSLTLVFAFLLNAVAAPESKEQVEAINELKLQITSVKNYLDSANTFPDKHFSEMVSVLDLDLGNSEMAKAVAKYDSSILAAENYAKNPSKATPGDLELIKKNVGDSTVQLMLFKEQVIQSFKQHLSSLEKKLSHMEKSP